MSSSVKEARDQGREKILVVDDEEVILDLLRRVLRREGYQVTAALRGEEALGLVSTQRFDLAIADVGLRQIDGRELVRSIVETSPQTAIVAMSGYPGDGFIRFAREHAQGYLEKPFTLEDLLATVRSALEERAMCQGEARMVSSPRSRKGAQA